MGRAELLDLLVDIDERGVLLGDDDVKLALLRSPTDNPIVSRSLDADFVEQLWRTAPRVTNFQKEKEKKTQTSQTLRECRTGDAWPRATEGSAERHERLT